MVIRVRHSKSLTELVSRLCMSVRMKPISFLVFSKMTFGSFDRHRKQFGAMTIARLFTSIFVTDAFSGFANSCNTKRNFFSQMFQIIKNFKLALPASVLPSQIPGTFKGLNQARAFCNFSHFSMTTSIVNVTKQTPFTATVPEIQWYVTYMCKLFSSSSREQED